MPSVNGKLYGWTDIVITIAGVPVPDIIECNDLDMETKYGAGRYPVRYAKRGITRMVKVVIKNLPVGVSRKIKVKNRKFLWNGRK